jgi:hypothetical protein
MGSRDHFELSPVSIHVPVEDKLHFADRLLSDLGLECLPSRERERVLQELSAGLSQLGADGNDWLALVRAARSAVLEAPVKTGAAPSEIAEVIRGQTAMQRLGAPRLRCQALGARALMTVLYGPAVLPKRFANGLAQLFTSTKGDWVRLSESDFLDPTVLHTWTQNPASLKVVNEYVLALRDLVERPLPRAVLLNRAPSTSTASASKPEGVNLPPALQSSPVPQDGPTAPIKEFKRRETSAEPATNLLEVAIARCFNPGSLDGYRLNNTWEHFHPEELRHFLHRLTADLAPFAERKRKLHACARHVTLLANLPLYRAWQLPIGDSSSGTMWLDVQKGIIGRVSSAITQHPDRAAKMHRPYTWETLLPEVVSENLRKACARFPQSSTLGELLQHHALSYEDCCNMAIDGWGTSHAPADGRISASLAPALRSLGIHPIIAALVAGDVRGVPASDFHYISVPAGRIYDAIRRYCDWVGLAAPPPNDATARICTGRDITVSTAKQALGQLESISRSAINRITPRSKSHDLIEAHKTYTLSVIVQLVLAGAGGRGSRITDARFGELFASPDLMILVDKQVDKYSTCRVVPVTPVLQELRQRYVIHLSAVGRRLTNAGVACGPHLEQIAQGEHAEKPAFWILQPSGNTVIARPVVTLDLSQFCTQILGLPQLNSFRHLYFAHMIENDVSASAMESLLGHHIEGFEPHGYGSGASIREMCTFLQPYLRDLHQRIGIVATPGLGQTTARYQRLPSIQLPSRLELPKDSLLRARIDSQDGNPRDRVTVVQDEAVARTSLVAHAYCSRLRDQYLRSSLLESYPAGSLLFCLIVRECVLAESDQNGLVLASGSGAWQIGAATVLEASSDEGRPLVQRIVDTHTAAALHRVRELSIEPKSLLPCAREQLHQLLLKLAPDWPAASSTKSRELLQTVAAHWYAIEVAPGAFFAAKHKSSFIPAAQLARMQHQRACIHAAAPTKSRLGTRGPDIDVVETGNRIGKVLQRACDKDDRLGGIDNRRIAIRTGLLAIQRSDPLDEFSNLLIDLHLADQSTSAPFRQLAPSTAAVYHLKYVTYFAACADEETLNLDSECMRRVFRAMGGSDDYTESSDARWAMLHIAAFLHSRGLPALTGILKSAGRKVNVLPRINVYIPLSDVTAIADRLTRRFEGEGGTYALAPASLRVWRAAGLRPGEARYASYADWDPRAKLLLVNQSGHDHLKTGRSMGYMHLSGAVASDMQTIWKSRRSTAPPRDIKLFAEHASSKAPFEAFDEVKASIIEYGRAWTGCPFRLYDLRISAVTDRAFNLSELLPRLFRGEQLSQPVRSGQELELKLTRFASASRLARHSYLLTTLRYYVLSGCIDLRAELDRASQTDCPSYTYAGVVCRRSPHSLMQKLHRLRTRSIGTSPEKLAISAALQSANSQFRETLAVPLLGSPSAQIGAGPYSSLQPRRPRQLAAALMAMTGSPASRASILHRVREQDITCLLDRVAARARDCGIKTIEWNDTRAQLIPDGRAEKSAALHELVHELGVWAAAQLSPPNVQLALATAICSSGSKLRFWSKEQLITVTPLLSSLAELLEMHIQFGRMASTDEILEISDSLKEAGIGRVAANSGKPFFACLSFLGHRENDRKRSRPSPRSVGRYGKLAIFTLLLSIVEQQAPQES